MGGLATGVLGETALISGLQVVDQVRLEHRSTVMGPQGLMALVVILKSAGGS
jgi:hypothetical protein